MSIQEQEVQIIQDEFNKSQYLIIEDQYTNEYRYEITQKLLLGEHKKFSRGHRGIEIEEVDYVLYKLRTVLDSTQRTFKIKYFPKTDKYKVVINESTWWFYGTGA